MLRHRQCTMYHTLAEERLGETPDLKYSAIGPCSSSHHTQYYAGSAPCIIHYERTVSTLDPRHMVHFRHGVFALNLLNEFRSACLRETSRCGLACQKFLLTRSHPQCFILELISGHADVTQCMAVFYLQFNCLEALWGSFPWNIVIKHPELYGMQWMWSIVDLQIS